MHFSNKDIQNASSKFRLNLINSISGVKPANLIGTISDKNGINLAIISSVVHLGSNPPFLGFIMRPNKDVRRDTYNNIIENGYFTVNHVTENMIERAHYTSAKFKEGVSEFSACNLAPDFRNDFPAPYVKESPIQLGLKHVETIQIRSSQTMMIVGEIQDVYLPDNAFDDRGYVRLDLMNIVGIGGLNSYYELNKIAEYPYAREKELPDFTKKVD